MAVFRALATIVLCGVAVFAADAVFRASLLTHVRPIILTPGPRVPVTPPVHLQWEGPTHMRVLLAATGADPIDLDVQQSPFQIAADTFPREGGYFIELRHPRFDKWIGATRWFQVTLPLAAPEPVPQPAEEPSANDLGALQRALEDARQKRDQERLRTQALAQEARALQTESERLAEEVEMLYAEQEEDADYIARLEARIDELTQSSRSLADENAVLQLRMSRVVPCTVWGYYSYPRPQTIPVTRRLLRVSDDRGRVFRLLVECESLRQNDDAAVSECFCVGNSFAQ